MTEQEQIKALLDAGDVTDEIHVICEDEKNILADLKQQLGPLNGLCAVVEEVDGNVTSRDLPGPVFDDQLVAVVVHENVTINRKKRDLTCKQAAKAVCRELHHKRITDDDGAARTLYSRGYKKVGHKSLSVRACTFELK